MAHTGVVKKYNSDKAWLWTRFSWCHFEKLPNISSRSVNGDHFIRLRFRGIRFGPEAAICQGFGFIVPQGTNQDRKDVLCVVSECGSGNWKGLPLKEWKLKLKFWYSRV